MADEQKGPSGDSLPTVAHLVDESTIVINKGGSSGVRANQRYVIFGLGEEIIDPQTKQSLGKLELVRGTGTVVHLQDKMATIQSDKFSPPERVVKRTSGIGALAALVGPTIEEVQSRPNDPVPFRGVLVGDKARPI